MFFGDSFETNFIISQEFRRKTMEMNLLLEAAGFVSRDVDDEVRSMTKG
jgi:hypothetical protein